MRSASALLLVLLHQAEAAGKPPKFPTEWGPPPKTLSDGTDYEPLAGGYGHGTPGLSQWIKEKMKADRVSRNTRFPPDFGEPPKNSKDDYVELPFDYGHGDSDLKEWLTKQAKAVYSEESQDYQEYADHMKVQTMDAKPICALIDIKNITGVSEIDLINCNITKAVAAIDSAPSPSPAPAKAYPDSPAPEFPKSWSNPPKKLEADKVPLPGGYGYGSSTLSRWIYENMRKDKGMRTPNYPPKFGEPPAKKQEETDFVALPFNYGFGSKELREWLLKQAKEVYKEDNDDYIKYRKEAEQKKLKQVAENSKKYAEKNKKKIEERQKRRKERFPLNWERKEACPNKDVKDPEFPKSWGPRPASTKRKCHEPRTSKYQGSKEDFNKCDVNHDGTLTVKEFLACPSKLRCSHSALLGVKKKEEELFKKCDKDGDGKLSVKEFMACQKDWRCPKETRRLAGLLSGIKKEVGKITDKTREGRLKGWTYCDQALAGGYGRGTPQLSVWIQQNIATDKDSGKPQYPPAFGDPPEVKEGDERLPFGYGVGSKELADWLREKAWSTYCEQTVSFERSRHGMRTDHWLRHGHKKAVITT